MDSLLRYSPSVLPWCRHFSLVDDFYIYCAVDHPLAYKLPGENYFGDPSFPPTQRAMQVQWDSSSWRDVFDLPRSLIQI